MKDYKFEFISTDNYQLVYTNKFGSKVVKPFTRDVKLARDMQRIQVNARLEMLKDLSDRGMTKDDLVIKRNNADGTITYDETNYREYEQSYLQLASAEMLEKVVKQMFNMSLENLLIDMGVDLNSTNINDNKSVEMFAIKFCKILTGKDEAEEEKQPSVQNQEQIPTATI